MGEKFAANPVTGTGSMTVPIATSPGRSGFGPQLALTYDSGSGNGPFGFGWTLSLPAISRKTEKGLPQYRDDEESDVFLLSGAEDLVPALQADGTAYEDDTSVAGYTIRRYRPRVEGLFARIERWTRQSDGDLHWRSISRENILTIYGADASARIADPTDPKRIFSWLISETRDDRGNAVLYEYKPEDGAGVDLSRPHERNRGALDDPRRTVNRYPKRIRYGNQTPLLDEQGQRPRLLTEDQLQSAGWLFEVIFDYGEHDLDTPTPGDTGPWTYRADPFSTYRAGFEVRTTRLCRRVLMFHHFANEPGVGMDCLVHSTDLTYLTQPDPAIYTFLQAVSQSGYQRQESGYRKQSMPPVTFEYSRPVLQETVQSVDPENLPVGLDDDTYQWADLHGEGIPGILTEQGGAWFYKRNLSPVSAGQAAFAPLERVPSKPAGQGARLMDLAGDGQPDLVMLDGPTPGLYEHDDAEGWLPFRPFTSRLNRDLRDPNLRWIDLNGDGRPDLLISEEGAFTWHASLAEEGFGPAHRVPMPLDEEHGPRLIFADTTQSIHLADLNGDGLTDLVRIRNGEVCYWPNLGYGRFGAKITMEHAPHFDHPDQFDPKRIRLGDIDGSGTTDIIYLHREGVRLYFNQSGNGWSAPETLAAFPRLDNHVAIALVDLLGNATACLVWSSPLPGESGPSMRYVDLMGGQKPHLLTKVSNNMGLETTIQYAPSTQFYLADKLAGTPWVTRLPFPVHVVERATIQDLVSRTRFVTRYAYHHGYFDGEEREFRGFGMVEQWDTEAFEDYVLGVQAIDGDQETAPEFFQPPVTTRTWYHTGAFLDREKILHQFRHEYYQATQHLPEPTLPAGMDAGELSECLRALKGLPLRQEVYSFDGSPQAEHPYSVVENTFEIRRIQPRGGQSHAVFFPVGRESVTLTYERNPADPRIGHNLNLAVDQYGRVLQSASVVYGRRSADPSLPLEVTADQQQLFITCGETAYTPTIDQESPTATYRMGVPFEERSYEITGLSPAADLFQFDELVAQIAGASAIDYEVVADGVTVQKRLLAHHQTRFLANDLNPLPPGQWDSLGLVDQSYQLAFTPGVITLHYAGEVTDADLTAAGYVHLDGDSNWWTPSATAIYPADPAGHFYLPIGVRDPMGVETIATHDPYDLLVERVQVQQATWLETTAVNDYRLLGPVQTTDPNGNRIMVEMDALGLLVKSAVMGKEGAADGDTLDDPTMRIEYDLFNWMNNGKPNYLHGFAREQHGAANPRWQESYTYFSGSGGVIMAKAQAHPGKALTVDPDGNVTEVDADPRWVGNGRTILNNKGNPVKRYEPYFSTTHEYEEEEALRTIGVTPVLYYDALGRNHLTQFPNGTFAKVEFDPWMQRVFDVNDTVRESGWYADRGSPDPGVEPEPVNDPERRAAWLAARHADTPGVLHADSLGRQIYAVSDFGGGVTAAVRSAIDLTGRLSTLYDQNGREVTSGFVGMTGTLLTGQSAEKGRRWTFHDVLGALVKAWDEHGRQFRTAYDDLHRPVASYVQEGGGAELLFSYLVYGDRLANARELNLLGVAHQVFDQAGLLCVPEVDFKGNPRRVERTLAREYVGSVDWGVLAAQPDYDAIQVAATPLLETDEVFVASSEQDALNRPTRVTLPDQTLLLPTYNEANLLSSLRAQIGGQGSPIEFLKEQDYDAKGQRQYAHYGNELITRYFYDPKSFRLINLLTHRAADDPATAALQDLHYTHDPVGNITQIMDDAQQTHYFANAVVKPESLFEYDAIYQLIRATGREHASMTNNAIRTHGDLEFVPQLPHANDAAAVRTYTETYEYDLLGNLKAMRHQAGAGGSWTRHYRYAYEDDPASRTNRLTASSLPGDPEAGPYSGTYDYDAYGNMTRMPHLAAMDWSFMDQLSRVDLGGGGTAYYRYGLGGQRLRKVIERSGNLKLEWIFLGAVMIFRRRRRDTNELRLERWTVHIADNVGEIAQVDTKTLDLDNVDPANPLNLPLIRYQYANHLGSAVLETNEAGEVISYEEYHPFGTTAYRSARPGVDLSLKRYRFSGKERDEETGLYYFGARYYAPWLGRWTSTDPAGFVDGTNLYMYAANNPIMLKDPNGNSNVNIGQAGDLTAEATLTDLQIYALRHGYRYEDPDNVRRFEVVDAETGAGRWVGGNLTPVEDREAAEAEAQQLEFQQLLDTIESLDLGGDLNWDEPADTPAAEPDSPPASGEPASEDPATAPRPDAATHAGPGLERLIWDQNFRDRGFILEHLYSNRFRDAIRAQGDNRPHYDVETGTHVQQIKSTEGRTATTTRAHASKATRDAGTAIRNNPTGTMSGKSPQAVVITPTDAPASTGADIRAGYDNIRRPVPNSSPPEHVRGLPGAAGKVGRGLTVGGTVLSGVALGHDLATGDYTMAAGDAISTAGGALEVYAIASPGATVAGASAMSLGLGLGGVGIAVTSGISGYRSYQQGDYAGATAGAVGVLAGVAVTAGVVFSAPALVVGGLVAAAAVGLFHLGRWLFS